MKTIIRNALILAVILFYGHYSFTQNTPLDSLENLLHSNKCSTEVQLKLCDDLSWEYLGSNFEKSIKFAKQGIEVAQKSKNIKMEATLTRNLGVAYYMNKEYNLATDYLDKALVLSKQTRDEALTCAIYVAVGNMYNVRNMPSLSLNEYNKALKILEKQDNKARICILLGNIGSMYQSRRNYAQAEKILLKAYKLATEMKDDATIAQIAHNMAGVCGANSRYKEAFEYATIAVNKYQAIGDEYNEALALPSLSDAYQKYKHDNKTALELALKAHEISKKIGYERLLEGSFRNLCHIYHQLGKYDLSEEMGKECLAITDSLDYAQQISIYSTLHNVMVKKGDTKKALDYFDTVYALMVKDTDNRLLQSLAEQEVKYETEKKEERIASLAKEKSVYIGVIVVSITFVILLVIIIILMNRYQRQKRFMAEERLKILEQEKLLLAAQSLLDGENMERGRLSRELHDGLGGLLTMIKLSLNQLKDKIAVDLTSTIGYVDNSIAEMRKMAHNIMPETIIKFGLAPTLTEFGKNISTLKIHTYGESCRYSENIEINFYRIACELINNALKHSDASQINVQLITSADKISLSVQDNGKGFSIKDNPDALQTVKSRVDVLGASIDILSQIGVGTEVTVELNTK